MTLRDFIQTEIEAGNIFDIEEFGTKLRSLEFEDGEEIPVDEFEDYLDYTLIQQQSFMILERFIIQCVMKSH